MRVAAATRRGRQSSRDVVIDLTGARTPSPVATTVSLLDEDEDEEDEEPAVVFVSETRSRPLRPRSPDVVLVSETSRSPNFVQLLSQPQSQDQARARAVARQASIDLRLAAVPKEPEPLAAQVKCAVCLALADKESVLVATTKCGHIFVRIYQFCCLML